MSRVGAVLMLFALGCVACRSTTGPATAPTTTPTTAPTALEKRFQAELDRTRAELSFPGATAAYVLADGTVGVAASGLADVESRTPMTPHTRMLAASIGKSFVAATALALAQDGALDLDAPIERWLSDRPWLARLPNHDSITLRQLLTHSSGLPDHVHTPRFARAVAKRWNEPGNPFPPEALVEYVLDEPARFPAGGGWSYSDTGYILVGLVIEQVARRPYYEELQQRLLEPLGLTATKPSDRRALPGLAAGYTANDSPLGLPVKTTSAPGVMKWNPAVEWTGGGLVSTSRDLAVWGRALYEGRAFSGPYLDELLKSVPVGGASSGVRYGAGVAIHQHTPLGLSYGHGGSIPGYVSSLRYYSDHRIAVAFQINSDVGLDDAVDQIERRLADVVVARKRKVERTDGT